MHLPLHQLAVARTEQQLRAEGLNVPVVLSGTERQAGASETGVIVGAGFAPHEIPGVIRHEASHFATMKLARALIVAGHAFATEQIADFGAGYLTIRAGDSLTPYLETLRTAPTDPRHGTFTQRATATLAGAHAALHSRR